MKILPPSGHRSKAENIIRDCIKNLPSKSSEIALWSVHVPEHATKEFSEVDFILLTRKGICCIEVKGGRVEYTNGSFIFINRSGEKNVKHEGPIQQVAGNKKELQRKLRDKFPDLNICLTHCAIFPQCVFEADDDAFEDEPYLILDNKNYIDDPNLWFENFIKKVFKRFKEHRSYKYSKDLSDDDLKRIRKYLRPNIIGIRPLANIAKEINAHIHKATEEQLDYLESITDPLNRRVLCRGPAGSGKTILALKATEVCYQNGEKVCFLVRNKAFKQYIKRYLREEIEILCIEDGFDSSDKFDSVVVDEGQDMLNVECMDKFESILKDIKKSKVFWFMDINNQSHLYDDFDESWLTYFQDGFSSINLTRNCRNPIEIINSTNSIAGTNLKGNLEAKSEETKISLVNSNQKIKHAEALLEMIGFFFEKDIAPDQITIITFETLRNSCVYELDALSKQINKPNCVDANLKKINFFDVLSYKGQENDFIILIDLYSDNDAKILGNQFYTALTRAKVQGAIIKHENLNLDFNV